MYKKYVVLILSLIVTTSSYAKVSWDDANTIYYKILKSNGFNVAPKLSYNPSREVNASAHLTTIEINQGMLNITNKNELALVIGHELAHWKLRHWGSTHKNEYSADRVGGGYATKAGYSACLGRTVFKKFPQVSSTTHPHPKDRYNKFPC